MRLLKIVAVPAVISLLLAPSGATEAKARSKILGKIQKNVLAQGKSTVAHSADDQCVGDCPPCHDKLFDDF